jgi:hypothetical protein
MVNSPHQLLASLFRPGTNPAQLNKRPLISFSAILLVPVFLFCNVAGVSGQQSAGREIAFPRTIEWNKQRGITRYRLQIAGDEQFQDVVFDGPVTGEQYLVSGLSAGYYYWRVAPIRSRLGFPQPVRFFVSGGVVTTVRIPSRAIGVGSR